MSRMPGLGDLSALVRTSRAARRWDAQVLHGHGAKGGAFARLAWCGRGRAAPVLRFYTPHGGSLHYARGSLAGLTYLSLEKLLLWRTDGLIFESAFSAGAYAAKIGRPACPQRVIHNGLRADEFSPVKARPDAADILFIGELRALKGVGVLLEALAQLKAVRDDVRALLVGEGPDAARFKSRAMQLGLQHMLEFSPAMPARDAFARGRLLVVPSLAESFPYIVLEAAAAQVPMIATNVGGIGEIFADQATALIAPGDAQALSNAISQAMSRPEAMRAQARRLREQVKRRFNAQDMAVNVIDFYRSLR